MNGNRRITTALLWALVLLWVSSSSVVAEESYFLPHIRRETSKIAFIHWSQNDGANIYRMEPDGSGQINLTGDISVGSGVPIWSPDGSRIAFEAQGETSVDIYVMNADGTEKTNLTKSSDINANPAWSPNGSQIVFEWWKGGPSCQSCVELYVVNIDGSNLTQLTDNTQMDFLPSWSPDGTKIAFEVHTGSSDEIHVMNADGTDPIKVTDDTYHQPPEAFWVMWQGEPPAWSPDSSRILFVSSTPGAAGEAFNEEIFAVNADGTSLANLTNNAAEDRRPVWSPDGTKIVFASDRDGEPEIFVMDADGSSPTKLTDNSLVDSFPTWSPDGSKIAFMSDRHSPRDIYVMNVNGSNQVRLTEAVDESQCLLPRWSP